MTGRTKELLETEVKPLVVEFLKARGLELFQEKTMVTHIERGFDFLGQNVRKYNGKLLIEPSKKNVKSFLAKVRTVIKANKQAKTGVRHVKIKGEANPYDSHWEPYFERRLDLRMEQDQRRRRQLLRLWLGQRASPAPSWIVRQARYAYFVMPCFADGDARRT